MKVFFSNFGEFCKKNALKIGKNGDGALTWQEFLNAEGISNCMDLMKKVTAFRDADTDKDDKVTRQEFVSYMSE